MSAPIEADIRTHLVTAATTAGTRFFYDPAPQGTAMPYGHIQVISTRKEYSHQGPGLKMSRVQVSCYGDNHFQAKTLAQEVEAAMDSLESKAFYENEIHMQNENKKHIALDFFVWH